MLARCFSLILLSVACGLTTVRADTVEPRVKFQTSLGEIIVQLDAQKAPLSVANFLAYVDKAHYDGTIFHRVMPGFMIQGGGFTPGFDRRIGSAPIRNEADNGLQNLRGTIAMARTNDPHSATAQFFINVKDNDFLNHSGKNPQGWGYAVFGRVTDGMDVVEKIKGVATGSAGGHQDVPQEDVIIESVEVTGGD